ncbi:MAG: Crp/Fnr family transcriptional regulator [Armatimonadetes bacterium]|nr:Crp/Fnr family transcriptional regulator [Armatimonadota bacterium]
MNEGILTDALPETITAWDECKKVMGLPRGHFLFHQGEPAEGLYVILSGFIKLYRTGAAGDLQVVRLVGPGGVLGHRSLMAREPLGATAEVIQDASFCFVPGNLVLDTLDGDPAVAWNMMRILARSLGQSEGRLLAVARMSTGARVASLLLEYADPDTGLFMVALTREEIGQVIGATTESVSRVLRSWESLGVIALEGRSIRILDRPALVGSASPA